MKRKIAVYLFIFFIVQSMVFDKAICGVLNKIKSIEAKNTKIYLFIDMEQKTILLKNLIINQEIPIGKLRLDFLEEYKVQITKSTIDENGKIIISGSDYYDGIGTDIKISFFIDTRKATVSIESHYEDLNLNYIPQRVPIRVVMKNIIDK